jgi:hypothetical protein
MDSQFALVVAPNDKPIVSDGCHNTGHVPRLDNDRSTPRLAILGQKLFDPVLGGWCDGLQQENAAVILHTEIHNSFSTGATVWHLFLPTSERIVAWSDWHRGDSLRTPRLPSCEKHDS